MPDRPSDPNPEMKAFGKAAKKARDEVDGRQADTEPLSPPQAAPETPQNGVVTPFAPEGPALPEPMEDTDLVDKLPDFITAAQIPGDLNKQIAMKYPEMIQGMIHRGTKTVIGGASKSYKSWLLLYMAICTAQGEDFFGRPCAQGPTLVMNLEIPGEFLMKRVKEICAAMGIDLPGDLFIWNLRDEEITVSGLAAILEIRVRAMEKELEIRFMHIVLDPLYMGLEGRDENSAGDMALVMKDLDKLIKATGAALSVCHHFAKGNAAEKEPQDRMSGSGVIARNADTIITLTPHEEPGAFTVNVVTRNFMGIPDFVLEWDFPIFVLAASLDPQALRRVNKGRGRPRTVEPSDLLKHLPPGGASASEWLNLTSDLCGRAVFYRELKAMQIAGMVIIKDRKYCLPE